MKGGGIHSPPPERIKRRGEGRGERYRWRKDDQLQGQASREKDITHNRAGSG